MGIHKERHIPQVDAKLLLPAYARKESIQSPQIRRSTDAHCTKPANSSVPVRQCPELKKTSCVLCHTSITLGAAPPRSGLGGGLIDQLFIDTVFASAFDFVARITHALPITLPLLRKKPGAVPTTTRRRRIEVMVVVIVSRPLSTSVVLI